MRGNAIGECKESGDDVGAVVSLLPWPREEETALCAVEAFKSSMRCLTTMNTL